MTVAGAGLIAALTLLQEVPAPPSPGAPDPLAVDADSGPVTELEEIEVIGSRLAEVVEAFVDEVAAPVDDRGLARWTRRVCVGAVNLRGDVAQAMVDRVSAVAREAGLEAGEPGCRPDVLIIAADDGRAMAEALVSSRPRAFRAGGSGMDHGSTAFRAFRTSDAPVRWWHVSTPTDSETGRRVSRLPGEILPRIMVRTFSGMRARIRDDLSRVIIIVDVERAGSASFTQLSDYVAMAALAQVDPEGDTQAYPTVLNLFRAASPPAGLTDWDLAYLRSLNEADNERILAHRHAEGMSGVLTVDTPGTSQTAD